MKCTLIISQHTISLMIIIILFYLLVSKSIFRVKYFLYFNLCINYLSDPNHWYYLLILWLNMNFIVNIHIIIFLVEQRHAWSSGILHALPCHMSYIQFIDVSFSFTVFPACNIFVMSNICYLNLNLVLIVNF